MRSSHSISSEPTFPFGGKAFPQKALGHLVLLGATGSGKSSTRAQIENSLFAGAKRAIAYDAKHEYPALLAGMGLDDRMILTNPFDVRAYAHLIAMDVTSPASAKQVARIYVPEETKSSQPFFNEAAYQLLAATFLALHHTARHQWSLRHVCLLHRDLRLLYQLLTNCFHTRHVADLYLPLNGKDNDSDKMVRSILATLHTKIGRFEEVAALYDKAEQEGRTFSLREDFIAGNSIIVLAGHEECREAIDAVNRALFKRATELLLTQKPAEDELTVISLDELREAGELIGLSSVLVRGRAYRIVCLLAAQDILGLEEVYGPRVAREMIGQCGWQAFLKMNNPETAEWAAEHFGKITKREAMGTASISEAENAQDITASSSIGLSEHIREDKVVWPSDILGLPPATARNGMSGYYRTPVGSFRSTYDFLSMLPRPDPDTPDFVPRSEDDQYLDDWRPGELERFGLSRAPENRRGRRDARGGETEGQSSRERRDRRRLREFDDRDRRAPHHQDADAP